MQKRGKAVSQVVALQETSPTAVTDKGVMTRFSAFQDLAEQHSIARWASRYLSEQVYGIQSPHTLDAKTRDLSGFVQWFVSTKGNGHIESWHGDDTQAYLKTLLVQRRSPATINRVFASLRHFARWVHEQPGAVFRESGLPTRGVFTPAGEASVPSPLEDNEVQVLFHSADNLVATDKRRNARPRRNRALLAMLFYTGLRVSEILALRRNQFVDDSLHEVVRKGNKRKHRVLLPQICRDALGDYLAVERIKDDPENLEEPLFLPSRGAKPMTRQQVTKVLAAIAHDAGITNGQEIAINPSRLRHTLGHTIWRRTGSATETASALGYSRLQYALRYADPQGLEHSEISESVDLPMRKVS